MTPLAGRTARETGPASAKENEGSSPAVADLGRLMTVAEVAAVMRVSRMTVYRLVHDDAIASVKVGRSYRVPERAVNAYLANAYNAVG